MMEEKRRKAMCDAFSRTRLLLGQEALDILAASRVAIFGLGGVGGYTVEALARSGIGAMDLIDHDKVSVSNLNRQILATWDVIGQYKTDVAARRIARINPHADVAAHRIFYLPETADQLDLSVYDYIVDAIDTVTGKLALAENAQKAGVPIISSMGTGNKLDPTAFEVTDIFNTSVCPLAKVMRRELKQRGVRHLKVVYSRETPRKPMAGNGPEAEETTHDRRRQAPGSTAFVPSVAGLIIAGEVIRDLTASALANQ